MSSQAPDPLMLGQRVVAILDSGARVATYKLAVLSALVDHSTENLPPGPADPLRVPIREIAARVLENYWPQVRPFEGTELHQSTGRNAKIPRLVRELRTDLGASGPRSNLTLAAALHRSPEAYERTVIEIAGVLASQPLPRLQRLPGGGSDRFLFDDTHLSTKTPPPKDDLRDGSASIVLLPGVPRALARLAGLLKPTLELMWVSDVRRMNPSLRGNVPDVAGHFFGRDRVSLAPARSALHAAFGPTCFYCATRLGASSPVDHVLPWSLVGIDGLANLVAACERCNGDKGHAVPSLDLVRRATERDAVVMQQISDDIGWPLERARTVSAARGVFLSQPPGAPTWGARQSFVRLDVTRPPAWLTATFDACDGS